MAAFPVRCGVWLPVICLVALVAACGGGESRKARHLEKGQAFLAAGNFEKARVEFRNALQIAPSDSEARFENGVVDEKLGNQREAVQFYQSAIDANVDNVRARTALARIYLFTGGPARALDTLDPALSKHPDDAELLALRAAARRQLKDTAAALADAERAVQLVPTNEDAVSILAGVYQSEGQNDKAVALLETAIKQIPHTADLRLQLAQLYVSRQQDAQAEALLIELVRIQPTDKTHRMRLAQYYARLGKLDDAERVLREGIAALPRERSLKTGLIDFLSNRRTRDLAENQLNDFIAQDPKDYQMRFALAQFYEQGKDYPKAEGVYNQVIASAGLDGPGITARDRLAVLRSQQNDIAGAEKLLSQVLAKVPRDDDALYLRGNLALAQKDPKTAIADLRSVLRDQPNAVGVMRVLAHAHMANGEPALAEETMRRAVEANPTDAGARLDLVQLLTDLGKPEQAKPIIDELVRQQPNNIDVLTAQFKVAAINKDLALAKTAADAIVAINPKLGLGYYYQGGVAEMQQRPGDAIGLYSTALEMQPTASEPLQALIRELVRQNRIPEALRKLDEAAAQNPQGDLPLNLKGEVLLSQKRFSEAIASFNAAIERQPKNWTGYRNLALAQTSNHDDGAAIATLQGAIDKVSTPEPLEISLAGTYQRAGKVDQAAQVYEDGLRRNPQSDQIANNLAMLLLDTKKDPASLERAKQLSARFASSSDARLQDTYGWVLYKAGEATAAVAVLETASGRAPQLAEPWYHLGMAQLLAGQSTAARDSLAHSLKAGQNFDGIDEARATLDKLAKQPPSDAVPKS